MRQKSFVEMIGSIRGVMDMDDDRLRELWFNQAIKNMQSSFVCDGISFTDQEVKRFVEMIDNKRYDIPEDLIECITSDNGGEE